MAQNLILKALTAQEQERFELLEKACIEGRQIFFIVGMSLEEIKRERYFEAKGFETFEDYAQSIGYSKRHCNQLIFDAKVVSELPEPIRELIQSERAARELAKIPETLRGAVAEAATEGGTKPATSAGIKKHAPPPPRKKPEPQAQPKATPPPPRKAQKKALLDETGIEVPAEIEALWKRGHEAQELVTYCQAVIQKLNKVRDANDVLFAEVDFTDNVAKLKQVIVDLKRAKPYAVCPSCQGKLAKDCSTCKGRGFVSEFYWTSCVPEEVRNLRK